jgi:hypothetical protein
MARAPLPPRGIALAAPRWRGQPGRLEVWYATATDAATGTGLWLHHEVVAPIAGDPYAHGWLAVFPPDAEPSVERFGPEPVAPYVSGPWFSAAEVVAERGRLTGAAGGSAWDLAWAERADPVRTFPQWAWNREVLPAAQMVVAPTAQVSGTVSSPSGQLAVTGTGAVAHIYGHGNAARWAWLHADLGDGDVLEIVTAVSRRPGMSALPPLAFVQLRHGGRDWPRDPLLAAPLFRTRLGLPEWSVSGLVGNRRLRARVVLPPDRSAAVSYTDPDGATATCTNSEVADAEIALSRWSGGWQDEARWELHGTAHAEVGLRP